MNLVIISSLASKCQHFKVEMPFFQSLYVMKLKTSKFKVLAFCCHWRYHYYTIKIKYWNARGSGFPPPLIPTLQTIGILHHKKEKLRILLQQSVHAYLRMLLFYWHVMTSANMYVWSRPCRTCMQLSAFVFIFELLSLPTGKTLSSTNFHFLSLFWPLKTILSLFL